MKKNLKIEKRNSMDPYITLQNDIDLRKIFEARISIVF